MRLIDLDEFFLQNCIDRMDGKTCEECKYHVLEVSCERLMEHPTIDAVEVVRCQNCGNSTDMRNCGFDGDMRFCHKLKIVTSPDWYCAAGARNGAAAKEAEEALSEVQTFVEGRRKDEATIQN